MFGTAAVAVYFVVEVEAVEVGVEPRVVDGGRSVVDVVFRPEFAEDRSGND